MRDYRKMSTEALVVHYCARFGKKRITNSELQGKVKRYWERYGVYRLGSNYSRAWRFIVEHRWLGVVHKRDVTKRRKGISVTYTEYRLKRRARISDVRSAAHQPGSRRH